MAAAVAYRSAPARRVMSVLSVVVTGGALQNLTHTITEYSLLLALEVTWLPPAAL